MNRRTVFASIVGGLAAAAIGTPAFASISLPHNPRVLILGDSYTEGYGGTPETNGYAYLIGAPLGWNVTVDGIGGTGYINPGPTTTKIRGRYADRLWRRNGQTYDLIVLAGGSNDNAWTKAEIAGAFNMTVRTARRLFPSAKLLVLGPCSPYGPTADRVRIDSILANDTRQLGIPYVSPVAERWFVTGDGAAYANPANGHPDNAGYRVIADRFVADLKGATR